MSYAIVTGLLVGVYAGIVLLTTQVLSFSCRWSWRRPRWLPRPCSARCTTGSSRAADRKFNRARYNADQTVAAFATRLQGEVDIGAVRADLLGTVNQTLEPVQVSVVLSPGPGDGIRAGHQPDRQIGGQQGAPGECS